MRWRLLENIHSAHQGVRKFILNPIDIMLWPSMRADIKETCERCFTCAQYANCHQPEPMLTYPILDLPWQLCPRTFLSMVHVSSQYLVIVDHYSDFFEIGTLDNTVAFTFFFCTKRIFARLGVPMICLTDNGPQFVAAKFNQYSKEWCFKHEKVSHITAKGMRLL